MFNSFTTALSALRANSFAVEAVGNNLPTEHGGIQTLFARISGKVVGGSAGRPG